MPNINLINKKGKFKLLLYTIEDSLIFYKSLNNCKRIIAFSIIEADTFNPLIFILNNCLNKRLLSYYAIQINLLEKNKILFLLNFEDSDKDKIIKLFHIIKDEIINEAPETVFFQSKKLENHFLDVILINLESKINVSNISNSIIINSNGNKTFLNVYCLCFNKIENRKSFFNDFLNLTNNYNRKGYLIFNFKLDLKGNIIVSSYFIELSNNKNLSIKYVKEINNFYEFELLRKQDITINELFFLLCRSKIFDDSILFEDVLEIFSNKNKCYLYNILEFNSKFEHQLLESQIPFKRLNKNLLFINKNLLFFSFTDSNYKIILKILKKYYQKYYLFFLILNDVEFEKIVKIENITLLKNLKIMRISDFIKINDVKKVILLKDP